MNMGESLEISDFPSQGQECAAHASVRIEIQVFSPPAQGLSRWFGLAKRQRVTGRGRISQSETVRGDSMLESKTAMHENVMLTCANLATGEQHPSLPVKPQEMAETALDAAKARVAIAHIHVRDPGMRSHFALIDPKALTRGPIGELLAKAFPEHALVTASTCEELLETAGIGRPDLVVVYIRSARLTDTWVQSTLELLRVRLPEASAVVLSDNDDAEEVDRALTHGARGYLPTSVSCEVAVAALRFISAGGTFVPANTLRSTVAKPDDQPDGERQGRYGRMDLTPRELSVIDLLREGKPNKLIARQLDMQENTVKVHVRNILRKLNAANRTHAALVANRLFGQTAEPVAVSARLALLHPCPAGPGYNRWHHQTATSSPGTA
jgi:DNA-binding NarL/FixJ family response regulator